jgi:Protein of unknown function (DUF2384)
MVRQTMKTVPRLSMVSGEPLPRDIARGTEALLEALERVARRVDERSWLALAERISTLADEEQTGPVPPELEGLVPERLDVAERLSLMAAGILGDFERREQIIDKALTTMQAARRLNLSRQGPHDRRREHQLLGVPHNTDWLFPAWQFDGRTRTGVLRDLPGVLEALSPMEEWDQAFWLTMPREDLGGRTPVQALRDGEGQSIVLLARTAATK